MCRLFNLPDLVRWHVRSPFCFFPGSFLIHEAGKENGCLCFILLQASRSPGCLCPFPPCEGVKECPGLPSLLLRELPGRMGPIVGCACGHSPLPQCQARSGLRCGYWVLKVRECKQSLPHMLPCCSGVF